MNTTFNKGVIGSPSKPVRSTEQGVTITANNVNKNTVYKSVKLNDNNNNKHKNTINNNDNNNNYDNSKVRNSAHSHGNNTNHFLNKTSTNLSYNLTFDNFEEKNFLDDFGGYSKRLGTGPNANLKRKGYDISVENKPHINPPKIKKLDNNVPVKKNEPTKKKSKYEDKVIKSDIIGDIEDIIMGKEADIDYLMGDDFLFYTNVSESEVTMTPSFPDIVYLNGWYNLTRSNMTGVQLFPRDRTRYVNEEKGMVFTSYRSCFKINSENISFTKIFNAPTDCARNALWWYARNVVIGNNPNTKYDMFDLLSNLPPGYIILCRTGKGEAMGFSTKKNFTFFDYTNSKFLVIENFRSGQHVWVGVKGKCKIDEFNMVESNTNMVSFENFKPDGDPNKVNVSSPAANNSNTCSYYGNSYQVIQDMRNEWNTLLAAQGTSDRDWNFFLEPSELKARCPITCAAVGIDMSREWASIWFGVNPFPFSADSLHLRMIRFKQLTSAYPSIVPFRTTQPIDEMFEMEIDSKWQGVVRKDGYITAHKDQKNLYLTNNYMSRNLADIDGVSNDLEERISYECKLFLSLCGLNKHWKGAIINFLHVDAPAVVELIRQSNSYPVFEFEFQLPFSCKTLPTGSLYDKLNKLRIQTLFMRGDQKTKLSSFRLPSGKLILGIGLTNILLVGNYEKQQNWLYPHFFHLMHEFWNTNPNEILEEVKKRGCDQLHWLISRAMNSWDVEKERIKKANNGNEDETLKRPLSICELAYLCFDEGQVKVVSAFRMETPDDVDGEVRSDNPYDLIPNYWARYAAKHHCTMEKIPRVTGLREVLSEGKKVQSNDNSYEVRNNDNGHNADSDDEAEENKQPVPPPKREEEMEAEEEDNFEDLLGPYHSGVSKISREVTRISEDTKRKLIDFITEVRTNVRNWMLGQRGRISGWRREFLNWVDRFVSFIKSCIKNWKSDDLFGSILVIFSKFMKFIANPDLKNLPNAEFTFTCDLCNQTCDHVAEWNDQQFSVCENCFNKPRLTKCPKCNAASVASMNCWVHTDEEEKLVLGYYYWLGSSTKLGEEMKKMNTPPAAWFSRHYENFSSSKFTSKVKKEEATYAEPPPKSELSGSSIEAPDLESYVSSSESGSGGSSLLSSIRPTVSKLGDKIKKTISVKVTDLPAQCTTDTKIKGYTPWIRQNWDYSSASKEGTGFVTSTMRKIRNALNTWDEDMDWKVGDEKTATFWCYREIESYTLNKAERRPSSVRGIKLVVRNPSVTVYSVIWGRGKVESVYGTSVVKGLRERKLISCREGIDNLMAAQGRISRPNSKLDVAFLANVESSSVLNQININADIMLQTKEFFMIKTFEHIQGGSMNFIPNSNDSNS